MLRRGLHQLHHTSSRPAAPRMPVVPWEGSMARYAAGMRAALAASQLSGPARTKWDAMESHLQTLAPLDRLYVLSAKERADPRDYAAFVRDPDLRRDLTQRMSSIRTREPDLWRDLTATGDEGAGLTPSELMALLDRLHFRSPGAFWASTPAPVLWWHGQSGLLHGVAPAVEQVESALLKMHASGRFQPMESRWKSGEARLYRGLNAFGQTFGRADPQPGDVDFAMCFQSCAATPGGSFAVSKRDQRGSEMVIVNPRDVPAVNMNRLIEAAFFPDAGWCETVLPIAGSGLEVLADQSAAQEALRKAGIEAQGDKVLCVKAFPLPPAPLAALQAELERGLQVAAPAQPPWQRFLDAAASGPQPRGGLAL